MSGHADTAPIIEAFDRLLAQDSWQEPYVKAAGESLDALLAENQRLDAERDMLRRSLELEMAENQRLRDALDKINLDSRGTWESVVAGEALAGDTE